MAFSFRKQLNSFRFAFAGVSYFLRTQHNAWIQSCIAILAILFGFILHITPLEWCAVLLCIGGVLSLEAVNSSLEQLSDELHPGLNEGIKKVKDLAAGAVLIMSVVAAVIGLVIFLPRLLIMSW